MSNDPKPGEAEDISIVMAVYNHEATVAEALESALMQEMPYSSRIYCLDDASTDNSAAILADYSARYPDKIRVFTSPVNQGYGKKSILYHRPPVNGRYWCLLAGDDYWTSQHKLARQVAFLDKNPGDFVGCSCNTLLKDEVTGQQSVISPDHDTWNLLDLLLARHSLYVHTSSLVWRNIYHDRGFFLPPEFKKDYARGDFLLMHMMLSKGGKIKNLPSVMSCYRVTGRGIWSSKSAQEQATYRSRNRKVIYKSLPLKYKVLLFLQKIRRRSGFVKRIIPGPMVE